MYFQKKKNIACFLSIDLSQHLLLVCLNRSNKSHRTLQFIFRLVHCWAKKHEIPPLCSRFFIRKWVKPTFSDLKDVSSCLSPISKQSYALCGLSGVDRQGLVWFERRDSFVPTGQTYQCVRHTIPSKPCRSETVKPNENWFQLPNIHMVLAERYVHATHRKVNLPQKPPTLS